MDDNKQIIDSLEKKSIKFRRSIARDLIVSLSSVVAIVMVVTIALNYFYLARKAKLQFETESYELVNFLQNSLILPLWNCDEDGVNEICEMFLNNETVDSLKVVDSIGKVLFENKSNAALGTIEHSREIIFEDQNIGRADVRFSNHHYQESNLQSLRTSLIILSVVIVVLVFFTAIFLNIFLRVPLRELLLRIDHVAKGNYSQFSTTSKQKEIAEIIAQFDHMALKIKAREKALDTSNQKLMEEISSHLSTEKALRKSEHRFRNIVEMLPEAIFEADTDMRLTFVNKQAYAMFGYTEADFNNGLSVLDMLSLEDRKKAFDYYIKRLKGVRVGATEYSGKRKDDSLFPILLHSDSIVSNGEVTGLRGVIVDMTHRKTIEEQLAKDQKMSSIGALAGGIAHDFNNILQPLMGFCELLKADIPEDSPKMRYVDVVLNSSMRAKELVQQILAFSRQSEHKKVAVRMQSILNEVLKLSRSTIPSIIEIHQDLQRDCGPVLADPIQLHQITMNLIVNAYHAVEASGGSISVRLNEVIIENNDLRYHTLLPGRYGRLTVSDTGCGIDPSIVDKIFDPYFTTKEEGKGTGLGLSVVYGIVQDYKGNITVSSTVGKGTTFEVLIPVMKTPSEADATKNDPEIQTGNEHIMLVDDEVPILTFAKKMLNRLGYRVTSCSDSIKALKIFKSSPDSFDLVITDMNMPKMTGDQLSKEMIAINPALPVIMFSGFIEKIRADKSMSLGIKEFLEKPVNASELSRVVRKVLDA